MLDIGFFIWKMSAMPANPLQLVAICRQYGISRLVIKVLESHYKYNVPQGDKPFMEYIYVLRQAGIKVEGWGYHYPEKTGLQGDAIEERRDKLNLDVYHLNVEGEWKRDYGMAKEAKAIMDKQKINHFEVLLCSYRYPSKHAKLPWDAFMNHEAMDGASPQVYWAGSHNPAEQLNDCLVEYSAWKKPVYPIGSTFGASFKIDDKWVYWEPSIPELKAFAEASKGRTYYYSLDWVLSKKRYDMIEAVTGINVQVPPPIPPPVEPTTFTVSGCTWVNGRSEPTSSVDNRVVVVRAGQQVENLKLQNGSWFHVGLGPIQCWIHGDYLD